MPLVVMMIQGRSDMNDDECQQAIANHTMGQTKNFAQLLIWCNQARQIKQAKK